MEITFLNTGAKMMLMFWIFFFKSLTPKNIWAETIPQELVDLFYFFD